MRFWVSAGNSQQKSFKQHGAQKQGNAIQTKVATLRLSPSPLEPTQSCAIQLAALHMTFKSDYSQIHVLSAAVKEKYTDKKVLSGVLLWIARLVAVAD